MGRPPGVLTLKGTRASSEGDMTRQRQHSGGRASSGSGRKRRPWAQEASQGLRNRALLREVDDNFSLFSHLSHLLAYLKVLAHRARAALLRPQGGIYMGREGQGALPIYMPDAPFEGPARGRAALLNLWQVAKGLGHGPRPVDTSLREGTWEEGGSGCPPPKGPDARLR